MKNSEQLIPVFAVPPAGMYLCTFFPLFIFLSIGPTPIVRILRYVLREKHLEAQERKLLILIATDGVPTNENGKQDIKSLEYVLRHERIPVNRIPVTIIACTDDNDCIG